MSGSVALELRAGSDWGFSFLWADANGKPYPISNPRMQWRTDLNPASDLIADFGGPFDNKAGVLVISAPGTVLATISSANTLNLPTGNGFWDLFVSLGNNPSVSLLFGTVQITPHVTGLG